MVKEVSIGARIDAELDADVAELAALLQRSKSWVLEQALQRYVASEREFVEAVQEGIDAADRGDFCSHEEVMAWTEEKIQKHLS